MPALQTHGIWESAIGDPDPPDANYFVPNLASAMDNAISSWNDFLTLFRIACTSSGDHMLRALRNPKDYSDNIDDSPPTCFEDALRKMKENHRESKEDLRKLKEKFNFKDVDSENDSSNSDIDPKIERFNKKSKSKVPVRTESLSRPSPNWNPVHEALQEVAKESKGLSDETIASFRLSKFKSGSSSRSKKPSDKFVACADKKLKKIRSGITKI